MGIQNQMPKPEEKFKLFSNRKDAKCAKVLNEKKGDVGYESNLNILQARRNTIRNTKFQICFVLRISDFSSLFLQHLVSRILYPVSCSLCPLWFCFFILCTGNPDRVHVVSYLSAYHFLHPIPSVDSTHPSSPQMLPGQGFSPFVI